MPIKLTEAMRGSESMRKYIARREDMALLLDTIAVELENYDEEVKDAWAARRSRGFDYGYAGTAAKIRSDLMDVLTSLILKRFGNSESTAKTFIEEYLEDSKEGG
jgi:hypothetical protein